MTEIRDAEVPILRLRVVRLSADLREARAEIARLTEDLRIRKLCMRAAYKCARYAMEDRRKRRIRKEAD